MMNLGWTIADGKQGIIDISIDSVLTPDNQPCGSIRYNTRPKKDLIDISPVVLVHTNEDYVKIDNSCRPQFAS